MPISSKKGETRKLFFWFWPSNNPKYTEDLVCVSLLLHLLQSLSDNCVGLGLGSGLTAVGQHV